MKLILSTFLLIIMSISTSYSQSQLERQIGEILKQEEVQKYFSGQAVIVVIENENCNKNICNPKNIKSQATVKIYDLKEAYMRQKDKIITILNIEKVASNITRFKVKMKDFGIKTFDLKGGI